MALIGNYSVIHKSPATFTSGLSIAQARSNFDKSGTIKNSLTHFGGYAAYPATYAPPYTWVMSNRTGGIGTLSYSSSEITNGALAQGVNLDSTPSASITLTNGEFAAIVNILSSFSASGLFTNAEINQLQNISTSIAGSASITDAQIETLAVILLNASMNGSISITNGALGAIIDLSTASSGTLTGGSIVNILVNISADIGGPTPLSPEGLANAVWSKDITDYIDSGTAGLKLNNASSAGNPWDRDCIICCLSSCRCNGCYSIES